MKYRYESGDWAVLAMLGMWAAFVLAMPGCELDTTPDAVDQGPRGGSVAVNASALIQNPIYPTNSNQGTCVPGAPASQGWCTTQSPTFEGAYFMGNQASTDYVQQFKYYGGISNPLPGETTRIGAIVRRANDCNMIYAFWRATLGKVEVWHKNNPGQTLHSQCGQNGWTQLGTTSTTAPIVTPSMTFTHNLHVQRSSTQLMVWADTWGPKVVGMTPAAQALVGHSGAYTNNGLFEFRMDQN